MLSVYPTVWPVWHNVICLLPLSC